MIKASHARKPQPSTEHFFQRVLDRFRRSHRLRDILEDRYIPYSRIATGTVRRYRCELHRWEKLVGDLPIHRIGEDHFREFRDSCQRCGLSNSSTEGSVKVVKILLRFARDRGLLTELPVFGRPLAIEEPEPEPATLDELSRLYAAADVAEKLGRGAVSSADVMRAFVVLQFWTGIRGQDLASRFAWKHVREDRIAFRQSKTGKRHTYPLCETVTRHLALMHGQHASLVFGVNSLAKLNNELGRMSREAEIRKLTTKHIRQACFTAWAAADETAAKLIHGCGLPRVLRQHYLGRLQLLQAAGERFRWFAM